VIADFGQRLHELRTERGWTQSEFARMAGVAPPAINAWETGMNAWPNVLHLVAIANAFKLGLDELLQREVPR
jgi:transcriptional regulator with XRE-family HTH domain